MIYTPEEKARMETLLTAFHEYIKESGTISILYSDKTGFVRISPASNARHLRRFESFDDMLHFFIHTIVSGEINRTLLSTGDFHFGLVDLDRLEKQLQDILNTLKEDREYCLDYLENYFIHLRKHLKDE